MTSTSRSQAAIAVARFTAVVVLPTPPFWLAMAKTRVRDSVGTGTGAGAPESVAAASAAAESSGAASTGEASVTGDTLQPQAGPRRVGPAGNLLHGHCPAFQGLGQFFRESPALRKQADRLRRRETRGVVEQRRQRCQRPRRHDVGRPRR